MSKNIIKLSEDYGIGVDEFNIILYQRKVNKREETKKVPAIALYMELPKDWEAITDDIFEKGGTDIEAHVALGLSKEQHKSLLKIEQYFEHFDNGMTKSEAWWTKWARENIDKPSKDINTKLFETVMRQFFAWNTREEKKKSKQEGGELKNKIVNDFTKKFQIVNK